MAGMVDQKAVFAERIKRINSGRQFEHADVVGKATQQAYKRKFGDKPKRPKRTFAEKMMVVIAFFSGVAAVLLGRIIYFNLAKLEGLPEAFYDLGSRGMVLFAFVLAGILMATFQLFTRQRFPALVVGCLAMHFGEAAVASNAPEIWSQIFSSEYAMVMAERGQDFRLQPVN